MKFYCDACNTKYAISDDKVRGKVLKVRCKNCGNVITVREAVAPAMSQRPTDPLPDTSNVPTSDWYYALNGQTFGPFSLDGLRRKYATAEIGDATYVWHEQLGEWKPVAAEPAFADALATGQKIVPSRQTIGFSGQLEAIKAPSDWKPAGPQAGAVPTPAVAKTPVEEKPVLLEKKRQPETPKPESKTATPQPSLPRAEKQPKTPKTPQIPTLPASAKREATSNVSAAPRKEQPNARPLKEVRQRNLDRLRAKLAHSDEPSEPEQERPAELKAPEPKRPELLKPAVPSTPEKPKSPKGEREQPPKGRGEGEQPPKGRGEGEQPPKGRGEGDQPAKSSLSEKLARVSSKPASPEPAPEPVAPTPVVAPVPEPELPEIAPAVLAKEVLAEPDEPTFVEPPRDVVPEREAISFELPPRAGKAAPSPSSTSDILDLAIGPLMEPPAPQVDTTDSGLIPFTAEPSPALPAAAAELSKLGVNTSESLLIDMQSMNAQSRKRSFGGLIAVVLVLAVVGVAVAASQSNKEPEKPTPTPTKVAQKDELVIRTYTKEEVGRIQELTLDDEVLTDEPSERALDDEVDDPVEPTTTVAVAAASTSTKGGRAEEPPKKATSKGAGATQKASTAEAKAPDNTATLQKTQIASATSDPLAALLAPRAERRTEINAPQDKLLKKMEAGLSKDQARIGFQRVTRSIRDCRERHNRHNAQLEAGKLMVSVTVDPSGGVSEFTLAPRSVHNTEFHSCMQSHQARWRFGEFAGDPVVINKSVVMQ